MIKDFKLLEHNLIPLALCALNLATMHLIYLLHTESFSYFQILVAACTLMLSAGVVKKNKYLISTSLLLYITVFIFAIK